MSLSWNLIIVLYFHRLDVNENLKGYILGSTLDLEMRTPFALPLDSFAPGCHFSFLYLCAGGMYVKNIHCVYKVLVCSLIM